MCDWRSTRQGQGKRVLCLSLLCDTLLQPAQVSRALLDDSSLVGTPPSPSSLGPSLSTPPAITLAQLQALLAYREKGLAHQVGDPKLAGTMLVVCYVGIPLCSECLKSVSVMYGFLGILAPMVQTCP